MATAAAAVNFPNLKLYDSFLGAAVFLKCVGFFVLFFCFVFLSKTILVILTQVCLQNKNETAAPNRWKHYYGSGC